MCPLIVSKSIYLVNPASGFPHYFGADVHQASGLMPKAYCVDQSLTTIAAMAPENFHVRLCDEAFGDADLNADDDFIFITGKVSQWGRMKQLAETYRKRKKIVVMGGPLASLSPELVRPYCDILVRGEMEDIYPQFFGDLAKGAWKEEYAGTHPDLSRTVIPRYDLYPNDRTLYGSLQTSRGCPYQCDFCDVIQYLGRHQRHKPVNRILNELDALLKYGYSSIFITDDNFATNRSKAKEKLEAMRDWNLRKGGGNISFFSQTAVDVARDEELMRLMFDAGLDCVFLGIETPNPESLKETNKKQNINVDFKECIQRLLDQGIQVGGGIMVGFDADGKDIFQRVRDFIFSLPVPFFSVGCLVAPHQTPLYDRLKNEGRLIPGTEAEIAAVPWFTNFVPKQMTNEELYQGMRWLCSTVYHPSAYESRINAFLKAFRFKKREGSVTLPPEKFFAQNRLGLYQDGLKLIERLAGFGPHEKGMVERLFAVSRKEEDKGIFIYAFLVMYAQIRHMYSFQGFYQETLAEV
jgi:radical SAM superfamily enzyme YgiQ (UPF0313 family)